MVVEDAGVRVGKQSKLAVESQRRIRGGERQLLPINAGQRAMGQARGVLECRVEIINQVLQRRVVTHRRVIKCHGISWTIVDAEREVDERQRLIHRVVARG